MERHDPVDEAFTPRAPPTGNASELGDARAKALVYVGDARHRWLRRAISSRLGGRFPVYLPAWLPHFTMRVYPIAGVANRGESYFVYLSTRRTGGSDANLIFTLDANLDPHTGGNRGPTISWAVGRYSYEIGYLNPDRRLIRAARSMVNVNPRAP